MFSNRIPADLEPNRLSAALARSRKEGRAIVDLTESNPTRAGFEYPPDLLVPLADPRALSYAPDALGLRSAREAVVADYGRRGISMSPDRIVLTASTSDAYSLLFKILCDAGDEVLTPRPSYPLFEHLTALDEVVSRPYDLDYQAAWSIDFGSVEREFCARTRALLLVSPNNPTGSFVTQKELDSVAEICAARDAAVIADEVFADYELVPGAARGSARTLTRSDVLLFSLGGLSKAVGLPQVKLGWIAVAGPDSEVRRAMARLELASDTYLSVATPVQAAAAELLQNGAMIRRQIQSRVAANYDFLTRCGAESPACRVLHADGGWYAVLQVPSLGSEEDLVLELLDKEGVLIHPGYFFDFHRESFLIASLLVAEAAFREGITRVLRHFDSR